MGYVARRNQILFGFRVHTALSSTLFGLANAHLKGTGPNDPRHARVRDSKLVLGST